MRRLFMRMRTTDILHVLFTRCVVLPSFANAKLAIRLLTIKRVWAVWTLANMSFNNTLNTGFSRSTSGKITRKIVSKRSQFTEELCQRISGTQIECRDALKVIEENDTLTSFFYVDPPYVGACQGHYDGYSQEDFNALIAVLTTLKGKFLLSSYRNEALSQAVNLHGWYQIEIKMNTNPAASNKPHTKIEVLTANYPIGVDTEELKLL